MRQAQMTPHRHPPAARLMRHLSLFLILGFASATAASGRSPAGPQPGATSRAATLAKLRRLVSPKVVIRDYAELRTERGEPAILFLFVTNPVFEGRDNDWMPGSFFGDPLSGVYHVGLVINGRLINELELGEMQLPLRNSAWRNFWNWGQGKEPAPGSRAAERFAPTKLLTLADFNEDGHAWEFRLLRYEDSSNYTTALVGYSARQRKVIKYPVFDGPYRRFWMWNMFPNPLHPAARLVESGNGCGNAADFALESHYEYDVAREGWVLKTRQATRCPGRPSDPTPAPVARPTRGAGAPPVTLRLSSAPGHRGGTVTVVASISPHGASLTDIVVFIPYDPVVAIGIDDDGDVRCHAQAATGTVGCRELDDPTCQWGIVVMIALDDLQPLAEDTPLFSCDVQIDAKAPIGHHPFAATILEAVGPSGGGISPLSSFWVRQDWPAFGTHPADLNPQVPAVIEPGDVFILGY